MACGQCVERGLALGGRAARRSPRFPLPPLVRSAMGLQSLPVAFGIDTAKWITVGTIDVTQARRDGGVGG